MSSQSTQNDSDTQVDIILAHKKKNLTVFEYVIANEKVTVAPPGSFIVIRIDGRRFKGFSEAQQWHKPIDDRPYKLMNRVASEILHMYDGVVMFASGQSDEFSFFLRPDTDLYHRRTDKIMTTIVSTFTAYYIMYYPEYVNSSLPSVDVELQQLGSSVYSSTEPCVSSQDLAPSQQSSIHLTSGCFWNSIAQPDSSHNMSHISPSQQPSFHVVPTSTSTEPMYRRKTPMIPVFDGKTIILHSLQQVHDYISWRQVDVHINNQYNFLFYNLVTPPPTLISHIFHPSKPSPQNHQQENQHQDVNNNQVLQHDSVLIDNPSSFFHSLLSKIISFDIKLPLSCDAAESLINGTNSREKVLLLWTILFIDFYSLPAAYRFNSFLFWSDYLPVAQQRILQLIDPRPKNEGECIDQIGTKPPAGPTCHSPSESHSVPSDVHSSPSSSPPFDLSTSLYDHPIVLHAISEELNIKLNAYFSHQNKSFQTLYAQLTTARATSSDTMTFQIVSILNLTWWFLDSRQNNWSVPSSLFDIICSFHQLNIPLGSFLPHSNAEKPVSSYSISISETIKTAVTQILDVNIPLLCSQLDSIQSTLSTIISSELPYFASIVESSSFDTMFHLLLDTTTSSSSTAQSDNSSPSPIPLIRFHFPPLQHVVPNLSFFFSAILATLHRGAVLPQQHANEECLNHNCSSIPEESNPENQSSSSLCSDDHLHQQQQQQQQPLPIRRVVTYHGNLIQYHHQEARNPTNDLTPSCTTTTTTTSNPSSFWVTHSGLLPYLSSRQQSLAIKKQIKKQRKQLHVQNRQFISNQLRQLSSTQRAILDAEITAPHDNATGKQHTVVAKKRFLDQYSATFGVSVPSIQQQHSDKGDDGIPSDVNKSPSPHNSSPDNLLHLTQLAESQRMFTSPAAICTALRQIDRNASHCRNQKLLEELPPYDHIILQCIHQGGDTTSLKHITSIPQMLTFSQVVMYILRAILIKTHLQSRRELFQ